MPHFQRLNLDLTADPVVGTPFSGILAIQQDTTTIALDVAVDAWIALLRPMFDDAVASFLGATLFKYDALSFVKNFRSSYVIGLAGTDTGVSQTARLDTLTFHTDEGNEMRLMLLESNVTAGHGVDYLPLGDANMDALADYVLSGDNWVLARDTSYPASFHRWLKGTHRKTFEQRYR